nr:integrase arm-type DNA-binding domain-containing protein [uncultured Desulfobulbus sp.]
MLVDTAIKNAKPKDKPYKMTDGKGLYLLIKKTGKYFRFDYRFQGKRKTLALGVYPDVSLSLARDRHAEARKLVADGIDPGEQRKMEKEAAADQNSFEAVAREWFLKNKHTWTDNHGRDIISRLEANVFPWIGSKPIAEVNAPVLLGVLRRIEDRGAIETAHRIKQMCGQVCRYAVVTGRAERDPSADLRGALPPPPSKSMATITDPKEVAGLLRAIKGYKGEMVTRCALLLAPLTFVRPGELRHAEWEEIDFDRAEWKIPPEKRKLKKALKAVPNNFHLVPLSRQALAVLRDLQPLTGEGRYVFPSLRTGERPMSENTVNAALRRMGYSKDEMTGHGFRAMASTLLHEQGWESDVIERQLAHKERNSVKAAYNYAQHLPERRKMMQAWADYLEALEKGAEIIPLFKAV